MFYSPTFDSGVNYKAYIHRLRYQVYTAAASYLCSCCENTATKHCGYKKTFK